MKEKKLKILHVATMTGSKASGVANVVPEHLKYQSLYAEITLLNCSDVEYKNEDSFDKYMIFDLKDEVSNTIDDIIKSFGSIDLVVFHAIYYPIYIKIYKELRKRNVPYIIIPHGSLTKIAQRKSFFKKRVANFLMFNSFFKNAKAIQYLTEGEKNNSIREYNNIVSGNGIELDKPKKQYNSNKKDCFQLIYIGRYTIKIKGLDILLDGIKTIKNEMIKHNIKLVLYGADYRGELKKLENLINKKNVKEVVKLNGPIYDENKIKELLNSDVFIQTSRTEGQPLGIMEAISMGIPCILTSGTNLAEDAQKNEFGWKTETKAEGIGKTILTVFNNKELLPQYSKNAIEYANNNFDWENISKKVVEKYKKIISK